MTQRSVDAFLIDADLTMSVGTRELAEPLPDEALIRVHATGICGSDLHVIRTGAWVDEAQWPATLGHEIYGTVEQAPADGSLKVGDHVIADSRVPCGTCAFCRAGDSDRCTHVSFVGECRPGGFATHCVLPAGLLHRAPENLHSATASLSEPLAVVLHGLSHLREEPRRVAILGHGPIGALTHTQLRRSFPNAEIAVAEPAALRAQLARALGARTLSSAAGTRAASFDTVIDCAGYRGSLNDALRLAAPRGQVVVLALAWQMVEIVPAELVESGIALTGSNAFVDELPLAISQLSEDPAAYEPVITRGISLSELPQVAAAQLHDPLEIKVVVCP